jgi:hypothetical protein
VIVELHPNLFKQRLGDYIKSYLLLSFGQSKSQVQSISKSMGHRHHCLIKKP